MVSRRSLLAPLHRVPDGRGRNPAADVPGDFATYRGTAATAAIGSGMRRPIFMHQRQPTGGVSECHAKWPDRPSNAMQEPAMPEVALISGRDF